MLEVLIYDVDGKTRAAFTDDAQALELADDVAVAEAVNYVSFVNSGTYGPPALVAPAPQRKGTDASPPTAQLEETVLYVNTSLVPLFSITRVSDEG